MKRAAYYQPGDIRIEQRDPHRIGDDELLVKVRAASLCGTDLKIFAGGHFKVKDKVGRVLGHELAGEIVEVGRSVGGFSTGQRVAFTPNIGCATCEWCRRGLNNMCPDYEAFGISVDGGFQNHMVVPASAIRGGNVHLVPDALSFEEAAVVEPLSCCVNAWRGLEVTAEDTVLIIGPGPIGACFVQLAKAYGARKVIVVGRRASRLKQIEAFGPDLTIDTSQQDVRAAVMAATGNRGIDVVVTAASSPELQPLAIDLLATLGRVNFFGGLAKGTMVSLDTNRIHYRGLKVLGTTGSSNEDYDRSLRLAASGQIKLKPIISHSFALDDIVKAFAFAKSGDGMKSMIAFP